MPTNDTDETKEVSKEDVTNSPDTTDLDRYVDDETVEYDNDDPVDADELSRYEEWLDHSHIINDDEGTADTSAVTDNMCGIFGMPYQFSDIVDPTLSTNASESSSTVGRKYNEKILSVMPVLFLTPGQPKFMGSESNSRKISMASQIAQKLGGDDSESVNDSDDEGRFYTFTSDFTEYKKYANAALRALAYYMGIADISVPIPGKNDTEKLSEIDIENFMSNNFTKLFGSQCVLPFFLDAETSISEDFSNDTTESMLAQTANGMSSNARELQFILGSKDEGGLLNSMKNAITDAGANITDAFGDLSDAMVGKNLISKMSSELTTVVTGGKIVFPEIWSGSSYSKSYSINIKLRSPDPDPISIFLNIYMPIILLISMAAPRQIGNSSNSYESPFLVRATYKSIFNCDLGIIQSLSITKGGPNKWNVMGQPITADVGITLKDLYSDMFISKRFGLLNNTAQMDYLATMAGVDLNEYEPLRMVELAGMILANTPRDFSSDRWGGIKRVLNQKASAIMGNFSDVRSLGI